MKDYVTEKELSQDILSSKYYNISWNGSAGNEVYEYRIDIELDDGRIITNAVKIGSYVTGKYGQAPKIDTPGESIVEAINRLGVAETIKYIIVNRLCYRYWNNQQEKNWKEKTIYRME